MSRYTNLPTFDIGFMPSGRMVWNAPGSAMEGGRNGLGATITAESTGGGIVVGSYDNIFVHHPEQHEYLNWVAARCNGSHRFINVPLNTDGMGLFPVINGRPRSIVSGIPHDDGSLFSDGSGYSQPTVWGVITASAASNAGVLSMRVYDAARPLRWSDWFSIYNDVKGWRAHRYWEVISMSEPFTEFVSGATRTARDYTLAVTPALRQAVSAGQEVRFARPLCTMMFPADFTLDWTVEAPYQAPHGVRFQEAF